jgi:thymidylate synthase
MRQYQNLIQSILDECTRKSGTSMINTFEHLMQFDLNSGVQVVACMRQHLRSISR